MNTFRSTLAASLLACFSLGAQAELLQTDWQTAGDGLATLDNQTGLEWLDITQTDGLSYWDVEQQLTTTYSGWRLPTYTEVQTLFTNIVGGAYTHNSTYDVPKYDAIINAVNLLGETYTDATYMYMRGTYKVGNNYVWAGLQPQKDSPNQYVSIYFDNPVATAYDTNHTRGIFLVSDGGTTLSSVNNPDINTIGFDGDINAPADVPTPFALSLLGLAGLAFARKKRQ